MPRPSAEIGFGDAMRRRYHRGLGRRRSGIAFAVMLASFGCYALPPDDAITPEMDHPVAVDDALPIAEPDADFDAPFFWPDEPAVVAILKVRNHGQIRIGLYPDIAPAAVLNFATLASGGFYDGVSFHRVIPGFMIQGGDPLSRDDDPLNDGQGGPGFVIPDEFGAVPFTRGTVAMANSGRPNSAGSQFFIVHENSPHLAGKYSAFGRVLAGFDTLDSIAAVKTDEHGRWGPAHQPLERVVIERIEID
ncbi:MAG: peptidylprolyl isomerase [Myxococcota bacterium]